jgi:transposase
MGRDSKYPDELLERAVRMVAEVRPQYPSQWAAITAVAGMLGIGTPETLRTWIRRSEVDNGQRPGVTSATAEENIGAAQGDRRVDAAMTYAVGIVAIAGPGSIDTPGPGCAPCLQPSHLQRAGRQGWVDPDEACAIEVPGLRA